MNIQSADWINEVSFNADGLIPAIAQDHQTHRILMMAWMNVAALTETVASERAVYWSRSRQQLWRKGETSGFNQLVKSIQIDCDSDVIILRVEQISGIACHTGRNSCFFRTLTTKGWRETEAILKDPKEIYPDG